MKKIIFILLAICFFSTIRPFISFATDTDTLSILLDPAYETKICPNSVLKDTPIAWGTVKDSRPTQDVSVMYKKDQPQMAYRTDKPLADYYTQHLQTVLKRCGMNLVPMNQTHEFVLNAEITAFAADMDKTLTKSQTEAESRLKLNFDSEYTNFDVSVAYLMGSKNAAFKNKKKLQKTVSDLFFGTLNEMMQSDQLRFLKK